MINRSPGEGRYARPEREQRWVLRSPPDDRRDPVSIVDRYLRGTGLRLRRMEADGDVVYKLGQKVRPRPESPALVHLTTMYLSDAEYEILARVDGAELTKTRWRWTWAERPLAVDEFRGDLTGLVLAEVELDADEPHLPSPPSALADVTEDDRFSGGRLAETTPEELARLPSGLLR